MQYYTMVRNIEDKQGVLNTKRKKIKGRKINLGIFPELRFFYYKDDFNFFICEFESGFSAGDGWLLKEAKEVAFNRLKSAGIKKTIRTIEACIKKHGYANKEVK